MDLTQEIILQHGYASPHKGQLSDFDRSAEVQNSLCGDVLKVDLKIYKNRIVDIVFSGDGCLISQAAASLLIGKAKKVKNIDKIKKFNQDTVFKLLGIQLTLSRVKCALLGLEALKKALINY